MEARSIISSARFAEAHLLKSISMHMYMLINGYSCAINARRRHRSSIYSEGIRIDTATYIGTLCFPYMDLKISAQTLPKINPPRRRFLADFRSLKANLSA